MYRVDADPPLQVVHLRMPYEDYDASPLYHFWAVAAADLRRFYRLLRTLDRRHTEAPPPMMAAADRQRWWRNTVGFLRTDCRQLRRFGVPAKRGVMLLGEPGLAGF